MKPRLIAFIILLSLILSACGKAPEAAGDVAVESGEKWSIGEWEAPPPLYNSGNAVSIMPFGDELFYRYLIKGTDTLAMARSMKDFSQLETYPQSDQSERFSSVVFCVDENGDIWLPTSIAETDQDGVRSEHQVIVHINAMGEVVEMLDISSFEPPFGSLATHMFFGDDGAIYTLYSGVEESLLLVLDSADLSLRLRLELPSTTRAMVRTGDGRVIAAYPKNVPEDDIPGEAAPKEEIPEGLVILELDETAGEWLEIGELLSTYKTIYAAGEHELYMTSGDALFRYDLDSGALYHMLDWLDYGISFATKMIPLGDGKFLVDAKAEDESSLKYYILEQTDAGGEIVRLSLATLDPEAWRGEAALFNKTSENVKIDILDYSQYNTGDNADAGLIKLTTEMTAGARPDLIDLASLPYQSYVSHGLLEDLYPLIDSDPDISREDLWPNILQSLEYDGGLYQLVPAFSVSTVAMKASDRAAGEWDYEAMTALLSAESGYETLFGDSLSRSEFLEALVAWNNSWLIDHDEGKCYFDTPEFAALLELAASVPESVEESGLMARAIDAIREGRQALLMYEPRSPLDMDILKLTLGEDFVFAGFPSPEGDTAYATPYSRIGMLSGCADKEAAWQFLRRYLLPERQNTVYPTYIPISKAAYEKGCEQYLDHRDDSDLDLNISMGPNTTLTGESDGKESVARLTALIESIKNCTRGDKTISNIVLDSAAPYFAGDSDAKEAARVIQSRVSLYIAEQG